MDGTTYSGSIVNKRQGLGFINHSLMETCFCACKRFSEDSTGADFPSLHIQIFPNEPERLAEKHWLT